MRLRLLVTLVFVVGLFGARPGSAQLNTECPDFPLEICDSLTQPATGVRTPRTPRAPRTERQRETAQAADRDCADFRTQADAQAFFNSAGAGDPHRLDEDNDGLACENLSATLASVPSRRTSLPRTGAPTDALGVGGISFLIGGLLLLRSIRRPRQTVEDEPPLIGW